MGKLEALHALVESKTTFMGVARTATKGKVVAKDLTLEGRKALRFFEEMPQAIRDYVESVNPKNLRVQYGTKGQEGVSVTGFTVLDGESIIAKGALGLDKTRGANPLIQARFQFMQGERCASMNFSYNGNNPFNGRAASSEVLEAGRLHSTHTYGDTAYWEFIDRNNMSQWMRVRTGNTIEINEIPTARQFAEYQEKANKWAREFTSGRRTSTPKEREMLKNQKIELRERRLAEQRAVEERKITLQDTRKEYETQIVKLQEELKAEIQYRTSGATELHEQIQSQKAELKKLQSELSIRKKQQARAIEQYNKEFPKKRSQLTEELKQVKKEQEALYTQYRELAMDDFAQLHDFDQLYRIGNLINSARNKEWRIIVELEHLKKENPCLGFEFKEAEIAELAQSIKQNKAQLKTMVQKLKPKIDALETEYTKKVDELKLLINRIEEEEKSLARYSSKPLDRRLEKLLIETEKDKHRTPKLQHMPKVVTTPAYVAQSLEKEGIKVYSNAQVIEEIRKLKGTQLEISKQAKNIFLKEMGFNPQLVPIHEMDEVQKARYGFTMTFSPITGTISTNTNALSGLSKEMCAAGIRHELDHFQMYTDLCKTIGIEKFKALVIRTTPNATEEMFNTKFWQEAIKKGRKLPKKEAEQYIKSIETYNYNTANSDKLYNNIHYAGTSIEARAYSIEGSVAKSFGIADDTCLNSIISRKILTALEKIEQKTGRVINREAVIQKLFQDELVLSNGSKVESNEILYKVLERLECFV